MKIESVTYQISFPDGEIYIMDKMFQVDGTTLYRISEDPTGYCLGKDLKWHYEPMVSSRTDEYLKYTRFKYDEAIEALILFRESNK